MVYSKEIKEQVFHDFENNLSVKDISEKYSISLSTLYKWKEEYLEKKRTVKASKKIRELTKEEKYDQALAICSNFPNNLIIQSQYITILIKQEKFEEAIKVCKKFPEYEHIQSQYISILIRQRKLKEAIKICKKFPEDEAIQSQYVSILVGIGKLKEATEICKRFPDSRYIQAQYINILINQNKLRKAILVCERFPNDKTISKYYKYLCKKIDSKSISASEDNEKLFDSSIFTEILNNIQEHKFQEIELEKLELTIFQKKMLVLIDAYNQKMPPRFLKNKIQELTSAYQDNEPALQAIQQFLIIIRKPILDVMALQNLLTTDIGENQTIKHC